MTICNKSSTTRKRSSTVLLKKHDAFNYSCFGGGDIARELTESIGSTRQWKLTSLLY